MQDWEPSECFKQKCQYELKEITTEYLTERTKQKLTERGVPMKLINRYLNVADMPSCALVWSHSQQLILNTLVWDLDHTRERHIQHDTFTDRSKFDSPFALQLCLITLLLPDFGFLDCRDYKEGGWRYVFLKEFTKDIGTFVLKSGERVHTNLVKAVVWKADNGKDIKVITIYPTPHCTKGYPSVLNAFTLENFINKNVRFQRKCQIGIVFPILS